MGEKNALWVYDPDKDVLERDHHFSNIDLSSFFTKKKDNLFHKDEKEPKFEPKNTFPYSTSSQLNESNHNSNKDHDSLFSLKTDDKTLLPKSSGDQRKKKLPNDKNKSAAKKTLFIGVGFALLISIVGVGLYFFKKYEKKRKNCQKK